MQCYTGVTGRNECYKAYLSKFSLICHFRLIVSSSCKILSSLFLFLFIFIELNVTQWNVVWPSVWSQMHGAVITLLLLCSSPPATHSNCLLLSEVCGPQQQNQTITLQEPFTQPPPHLLSPVTWEKIGKLNPSSQKTENKLSDCFSHMPARTRLPKHPKFWNSYFFAVIQCLLGMLNNYVARECGILRWHSFNKLM